jgi:hypothetical protein
MSISLYHMTEEYRQALEELTNADLPEEVVRDTLEALSGELYKKSEAVAAFTLNLDAELEAIKLVEKRITDKRKQLEKRTESLREYLLINMQKAGITEIRALDGSFTAKLGKGRPSVVIDDDKLLPDDSEFVRWTKAPNKVAIANALKDGRDVPGCRLEVARPSLVIK